MPLGIDQKVGTIVWSPLSSGRLSGKYRRNKEIPQDNRIQQGGGHGPVPDEERLYTIVDALDMVAEETGKSVAQVAINWLLQRPTVSNVIIGARNEEQLKQNLGAAGWNLSTEQVKKLDEASKTEPIYPYWHQQQNIILNPPPVFY
jgi:aryl-alcohol dehydrogenase-like predicted oxidoreductase